MTTITKLENQQDKLDERLMDIEDELDAIDEAGCDLEEELDAAIEQVKKLFDAKRKKLLANEKFWLKKRKETEIAASKISRELDRAIRQETANTRRIS